MLFRSPLTPLFRQLFINCGQHPTSWKEVPLYSICLDFKIWHFLQLCGHYPIKFRVHKSLQKPRMIMTEGELVEMLERLSELDYEAYRVIYVLCHTGARKNEIRPLKWSQVDFATGFINLHHTKNGEDRSIAMNDQLRSFLNDMPKDHEHVFLNRKGLLISPWQVDNALAKLQKKYPDMKKFRCHDLRHSFSYNYLLKGGNMYSLQQVLGHKQIGLTVDLYGGLRARDLKEVSPYGF